MSAQDVACFWTDLVFAKQDCKGDPSLPDHAFVTSSGGGSGGAQLLVGDWIGGDPNLIATTLAVWLGYKWGDGPTASIVSAADADGVVVYERAASAERCYFRCAGPIEGDPGDRMHIYSHWPFDPQPWAPWAGAQEDVPYEIVLEFLDPQGHTLGVAAGQLTLTPGV